MAVACGSKHSLAISEDGGVLAFGRNTAGQLGVGDDNPRLTPSRVDGLPGPVRQVAAGFRHSAFVTDDGALFMCGEGDDGRLGLGNESPWARPMPVPAASFADEAVLMAACGYAHSVVATQSGAVYTFGLSTGGELGHGDRRRQLLPKRVEDLAQHRIVMVAAGREHSVALSDDGFVFAWGYNRHGCLGINSQQTHWLRPVQIDPQRFAGEKVVFVAAGKYHTAAVTAGGHLYTWGCNLEGQLGFPRTVLENDRLFPGHVEAEWEGSTPVMVACGPQHTVVLTADGAAWVAGDANTGQNGNVEDGGDTDPNVFKRVSTVTFGPEHARERIVTVSAGGFNSITLAVTDQGSLFAWGWEHWTPICGSMLGMGNQNDYHIPTNVDQELRRQNLNGIDRVGRYMRLPTRLALAFAMGTLPRLNADSPVRSISGEVGLVGTMIARNSAAWPGAPDSLDAALATLLGGSLQLE